MAFARVAPPARWTPLLLTAAAMVCLLAALIGGQKVLVGAGQALAVPVGVSAPSQCGHPSPRLPEPGFYACATAENEAEHGRPGTPTAPGWRQAPLSGDAATVATAVKGRSAAAARPLRSHLSQAPPVRA